MAPIRHPDGLASSHPALDATSNGPKQKTLLADLIPSHVNHLAWPRHSPSGTRIPACHDEFEPPKEGQYEHT